MANEDDKTTGEEDRGNLVLRLLRELREQIGGMDAKIDRVDARAVDVVRKVDAARLDIRDLGLQVALLETRMTIVHDFMADHDRRISALETQ